MNSICMHSQMQANKSTDEWTDTDLTTWKQTQNGVPNMHLILLTGLLIHNSFTQAHACPSTHIYIHTGFKCVCNTNKLGLKWAWIGWANTHKQKQTQIAHTFKHTRQTLEQTYSHGSFLNGTTISMCSGKHVFCGRSRCLSLDKSHPRDGASAPPFHLLVLPEDLLIIPSVFIWGCFLLGVSEHSRSFCFYL